MKQAKAKKGPRRIVRQLYKDQVFINFLVRANDSHPVKIVIDKSFERVFVLGEHVRIRKITSG